MILVQKVELVIVMSCELVVNLAIVLWVVLVVDCRFVIDCFAGDGRAR